MIRSTKLFAEAAENFGTPLYLYDENILAQKCREALSMPNAFGLGVRFAMKANSNKTILRVITDQGLMIDASSLNEAKRAVMAGVSPKLIALTTQEVPMGSERADLEKLILAGLKYNVCSFLQLQLIADFAKANSVKLSMRLHPGVGSGESASRNTGDNYSCFGVHNKDIKDAVAFGKEKGLVFDQVHVHIGSGADPEAWQQNIDIEMDLLEKYFPDANTISFGGGLKEARMPGETSADIKALGEYAKKKIEEFHTRTGRKLFMEIEPGTFIVANCGFAITKVLDKKQTGNDGFNFIILDGGMNINARPVFYGSKHPFYVISENGEMKSSEFDLANVDYSAVVVGRCCETGDSQCITETGVNYERKIAEPEVGDLVVIGGAGAYCSSMTPFNYNSHTQIPEVLLTIDGELKLIRKRQTLEQIVENEI